MSKFFQAIDQAERDRAVREESRQRGPESTQVPPHHPPTDRPVAKSTRPPGGSAPAAGDAEGPQGGVGARQVPATRQEPTERVGRLDDHLVTLVAPTSFETEQYRSLRHVLEQMHRTKGLTLIGVSSPTSGDGKSTTTINVAGALAQAPEA